MFPLTQTCPISFVDVSTSELRAEAGRLNVRFVERLVFELENGTNAFTRPGEILLGAFRSGQLIGVGGLNQEPFDPAPWRARLRHVYVLQRCRKQGVATQLVSKLLDHARASFREVRLRTASVEASALYESMGFRRLLCENATHVLQLASE